MSTTYTTPPIELAWTWLIPEQMEANGLLFHLDAIRAVAADQAQYYAKRPAKPEEREIKSIETGLPADPQQILIMAGAA